MANSDKNILIRPSVGQSTKPEIAFTGSGISTTKMIVEDSTYPVLSIDNNNEILYRVSDDPSSSEQLGVYGNNQEKRIGINSNSDIELNPKEKVIVGGDGLTLPMFKTEYLPTSEEGTILYNSTEKIPKVYNSRNWVSFGSNDGSTPERAAISASQLRLDFPEVGSGVYWLRTPDMVDAVQVYIDFRRDGGGWVLVSKWGGHSKSVDAIYNANAYNEEYLVFPTFSGYGIYSRLSRESVNSLWNYSKGVCRIHFQNDESTGSSGVYFQRKITNRKDFDFWNAHYSPVLWSDFAVNTYQATGGGTSYEVCFAWANTAPTLANYPGVTTAVFDPSTDDITGGTGLNANMGWWDRHYPTASNFEGPYSSTIESARHMGFFGDINQGNQWLFTNNPADSRFSANENRQSMIFLRM